MTTKIKTIVGLVAAMLIITAADAARAQVGPEMRDTKTAEGMTIHGPVGGQYFRMLLRGKDTGRVRTTKKYWYRVDGVQFQFFSEDQNNFVMTDVPKALDDRAVLDLYRSDYLRRFAGTKPPHWHTAWIKLSSGKTALFWSYRKDVAAPKPGHISEHEMFLVVAGPGHVFGLFAQVPPGRTETDIRAILTRTLGTLTFNDKPDLSEPPARAGDFFCSEHGQPSRNAASRRQFPRLPSARLAVSVFTAEIELRSFCLNAE